jgi:hypothetical protein
LGYFFFFADFLTAVFFFAAFDFAFFTAFLAMQGLLRSRECDF